MATEREKPLVRCPRCAEMRKRIINRPENHARMCDSCHRRLHLRTGLRARNALGNPKVRVPRDIMEYLMDQQRPRETLAAVLRRELGAEFEQWAREHPAPEGQEV